MACLSELPPESQAAILGSLSHEDLARVRLVSKQLCSIASRYYFQKIVLYPNFESPGYFQCISDSLNLARHVYELTLYTHSQPGQKLSCQKPKEKELDYGAWAQEDGKRSSRSNAAKRLISQDYLRCLTDLPRLPRVNSVNIVFTPGCLGPRVDRHYYVPEDIQVRRAKLIKIFQALKLIKPHSLRIQNLQDFPDAEIASCDGFKDVIENICRLEILLIAKSNLDGPDHDIDELELLTFYPSLVDNWLTPASAHLTHLSLKQENSAWGSMPGHFSLRNVQFPVLRYLI